MKHGDRRGLLLATTLCLTLGLAACSPGGFSTSGFGKNQGPFAPGINTRKKAVSGTEVGHRLIEAGEYELALDAFTRAALDQGMNAEILSGLGSANLGLGRLGQAEQLLRRATKAEGATPEVWNNLGVVLMERGKTGEAEQIFRKAYALDDGRSDAIRDNLRLSLEKGEKTVIIGGQDQEYKLVRRGSSDYLIRTTP